MARPLPKPADARDRLRPGAKLTAIARSPLLNELSPIELIVYLRLVGMSSSSRRGRIAPRNAELYRWPRATIDAVHKLQERKLIRIHYSHGDHGGRQIEVLR